MENKTLYYKEKVSEDNNQLYPIERVKEIYLNL